MRAVPGAASPAGVTRRALIQAALALVGVDAVRAADQPTGPTPPPVPGDQAPRDRAATRPAGLTEAEVDDLVAFGEILVEGGSLGADERRQLVEHIGYRVSRQPEYVSLYRTTLRELEQLAGARFSALAVPARLDLVTRHRLAAADPPPAPGLRAPGDPARRNRGRVVRDLIAGYYGSPAGWATVGQSAFPGRCGDPTRYTRPEA